MPFPLIALAATLLPELVRLVAGDRAGKVAGTVSEAVRQATGTDDPDAARAAIERDPALASQLRVRLAEIALEEGHAQREAEAQARRAELSELRARLADTASARDAMTEMARARSPLAWGPALVSTIVVITFFTTLVLLIALNQSFQPETAALVNITVGTLGAAFAGVVNFWIGSSQSSREKDRIAQTLQAAHSAQSSAQVQSAITSLRDVASSASAPSGSPPGAEGGAALPPQSLFRSGGRAAPAPLSPEARFDRCVATILEKEGGFVDDPRDPGGATNMGITLATLRGFREAEVTPKDVRELSREEAREIYRSRYWTPMRCTDLPAGVELMVFDFGVNAGPSRAIKLLQHKAGARPDGSIGPVTLAAVRANRPQALIVALAEARLDYYRMLDTYETFGRGWTARTDAVRLAALAMAESNAEG